MLEPGEIKGIEKAYNAKKDDYLAFSDYVLARCMGYKQNNPKSLRILFSREPRVKTLDSVTQKISILRESRPAAQFSDLVDVVALTALFSYTSDIRPFTDWLRRTFSVTPASDELAKREYESGHCAYHFALRLTDTEGESFSRFLDLQCELQVKTVVQEAFDAKSHDLAYKPGKLEVGRKLKEQFAVLSSALGSIDLQSEFLKDLILSDQRDLDLRRAAILKLYFDGKKNLPAQAGLDPENLPPPIQVLSALKSKAPDPMTTEFCKFAVFCALKLDSNLLKNRALEWVNKLVEQGSGEPWRFGVRGTISWAFCNYEDAINDMERIISWKTGEHAPGADRIARAKNNFVYYVCDCELFKHDVRDEWRKMAKAYVRELRKQRATEEDTLGFYEILHGKTFDEIERGRAKLKRANKARSDSPDSRIYNAFYELHDHAALLRLLEMSKSHNRGNDQGET